MLSDEHITTTIETIPQIEARLIRRQFRFNDAVS